MPKMVTFYGQTVLPDRSLLMLQKLIENAKIIKCNIFKIFQILWIGLFVELSFYFMNFLILISFIWSHEEVCSIANWGQKLLIDIATSSPSWSLGRFGHLHILFASCIILTFDRVINGSSQFCCGLEPHDNIEWMHENSRPNISTPELGS